MATQNHVPTLADLLRIIGEVTFAMSKFENKFTNYWEETFKEMEKQNKSDDMMAHIYMTALADWNSKKAEINKQIGLAVEAISKLLLKRLS